MQVPIRIKAIAVILLGSKKLELVILTMVILSQWIFLLSVLQGIQSQFQIAYSQQSQQLQDTCITYDSTENVIRISCKYSSLTDIDNQLQDPDLLHKES